MEPGELVGNGDLDVHDGFQQRGLGLLHGFAEGDAASRLERQLVGIHVVIRAVVEDDPEIDHRDSRPDNPRCAASTMPFSTAGM